MGIRFLCPNGHRLNVKASLAGKRGVCPHCGVKFPIPLASTIESKKEKREKGKQPNRIPARRATHELDQRALLEARAPRAMTSATALLPIAEIPVGLDAILKTSNPRVTWHVRHPHGGQYGPADTATLRDWFIEGRIPPDAHLWRSDWEEWKRLADLEQPSVSDVGISAIRELVPHSGPIVPLIVRKKQRRVWAAVVLLGVASLVMLVGLIVVLATS